MENIVPSIKLARNWKTVQQYKLPHFLPIILLSARLSFPLEEEITCVVEVLGVCHLSQRLLFLIFFTFVFITWWVLFVTLCRDKGHQSYSFWGNRDRGRRLRWVITEGGEIKTVQFRDKSVLVPEWKFKKRKRNMKMKELTVHHILEMTNVMS